MKTALTLVSLRYQSFVLTNNQTSATNDFQINPIMSDEWTPAKSELDVGIHGLTLDDIERDTRAVSSNLHYDGPPVQPLVTPIYTAATYKMESVQHYLDVVDKGAPIYIRLLNPTVEDVECTLNGLEGGAGSLVFSSGMAAITTALMCLLKSKDHVICGQPCYSGLHRFLTRYIPKFNIEVTWVPAGCEIETYRKNIKPNTKMMLAETPCNPSMAVVDLEEFGKLGRETGILTFVDGTFASPYLQQPIKYGVDISMHSCTKYLGGHSDLLAGVLTTRTVELWQELSVYRSTIGNILSPYDAAMLRRGIKTLHVRMARHSENARKLAQYLEQHPKVGRVYYPGLASHPHHERAKKQMKDYSGMMAFEMKGGLDAGKTVVENVRLIKLAVSLGGVESLIEHPATMTHGPMMMPEHERIEAGITEGLIRFSVGIEDFEDLRNDLEYAISRVS